MNFESVYMASDPYTHTKVDLRDLTPQVRRAWRKEAAGIDLQVVAVCDLISANEDPVWIGDTTNRQINQLALLMGDVVQWSEAAAMHELLTDNGHIIGEYLVCEHQTWEDLIIETYDNIKLAQVNQ
jgi:hypothetical protein